MQYIRKHAVTDININAYKLQKKSKYTVVFTFCTDLHNLEPTP